MNSPLPFSKPASYPRPTYGTTLCSPISLDVFQQQLSMDHNTSFSQSTSSISTLSSWPAVSNQQSLTLTPALTSDFPSSDTSSNSKSWTTKHLKAYDSTSYHRTSNTNSCHPSQSDLIKRNGRYRPSNDTSSRSLQALTRHSPSTSGMNSFRRPRAP